MNSRGLYLLFLIDSRSKEHDGRIFSSYSEAREYASECLAEKYCTKAVIGFTELTAHCKEGTISMVETIGFKGDKKNVNQLQLFQERKKNG